MKKRVFSVFCVLALCLGLLPVTALAADDYSVSVGNVTLNSSNPYAKSNADGTVERSAADDYNIYLDASTHTLTLQDATVCEVDSLYRHAVFTKNAEGIHIVLEGDNKVTGKTDTSKSAGIYAMHGPVSITGTGSLTVTSEHSAIWSGNGMGVTISGDVTVEATSTEDSGIYSGSSTEISSGAHVTVVSTSKGNKYALHSSGDMAITDSTLLVEAENDSMSGIYAEKLTIAGSVVRSISPYDRAISVEELDITGGSDVYAEGGADVSMVSEKEINIAGATVTAVSESGHGIYSFGGIRISDGAVVKARTTTAEGYPGLRADGKVSIESATVKAASSGSYGIYSGSGSITVSGESDVSINGAPRALYSGIEVAPAANRQFAISGGADEGAAVELDASPVTQAETLDQEEISVPYLRIQSQLVPVAAPVLTESGSFYGSMRVEISCATEGADIYYTTDGSEPSPSAEKYTQPFTICETTTVKAIAVKADMADSEAAAATYTLKTFIIPDIHNITVQSSTGGRAEVQPGNAASAGMPITITVMPDEDCELVSLTVTGKDGREIQLTDKGDGRYIFTMPGMDVTVSAIFLPDYAACDGGADCPLRQFTDVDGNAWYHNGVHFCLDSGLMEGSGNGLFMPNNDISRAQFCQILYNMEGQPATGGGNTFPDVVDDAWYAGAVNWSASQGIVTGYGNGLFGTNDPITREQLATMLWRYAQARGYDVSVGENTNILAYRDAADLSEWAIPAMQWACGAGIINGTGDGSTLSPQGQATRAQAAVMLMRFCEAYVVW